MKKNIKYWQKLHFFFCYLFFVQVLALFLTQSAFTQEITSGVELVQSARQQIGKTLFYDSSYTKLKYPQGDVPLIRGVCTDVVIRALRQQNIDLQLLVHRDMRKNFSAYPKMWGLKRPDPNIDHRRVPNLMTFFQRMGFARQISQDASVYKPGDIVAWQLDNNLHHIGIVSESKTKSGVPYIIHNIGLGAQEQDILFRYKIIGHYRLVKKVN